MTEKYKKVEIQNDLWIDKLADKVSGSKIARAVLGLMAVGTTSQMAACMASPPAEVAQINEALLSGVIDRESLSKLSGNSKIIIEDSFAYIDNKYVEDKNFVPGTEMIYAVSKGTDSFAWYLAGFKNEDGSVGLKVTDYCDSLVRNNEDCQSIEKDLLMVEGSGNRLYGFIDENNEQHPILLIDKENNPTAFDLNSSSYTEKVANSQGFLDKIVSIGVLNVQAAELQTTATPPVVETSTPTVEPTAMPTETKERYELDLEKLNNFPSSMEYLIAHQDEFVEAPNPFEDSEVFKKWWDEKIIPALGKREDRKKNMIMTMGGGYMGGFIDSYHEPEEEAKPILEELKFVYFRDQDVIYPIPIINVGYETDPYANFTMGIILYDGRGSIQGRKAIELMAKGEEIYNVYITVDRKDVFPEEVNRLIELGLNGYGDIYSGPEVTVGVGGIRTVTWRDYSD